jgi:hypothetical protein
LRALTDVSGFLSPVVPDMLGYWLQKSAGRQGPARRDIDMLDMPRSVLPHVLLADVEPSTHRMKFRLVGTHAAQMYNFDFTGRYLDELKLPGGLMDIYHESYQFVAQSKTPLVGHAGYPKRPEIGGFSLSEFALLPLMDGDSVSQVLVVDHMGADGQSYSDELIGMSLAARSQP